jgi:hypothetical protein
MWKLRVVLVFCSVFYIPTMALKLATMSDFYCYRNTSCFYNPKFVLVQGMKLCGRMEVKRHSFLVLAPSGDELPFRRPSRFIPMKKAHSYPLAPKLVRKFRRKNKFPCRDSSHGPSNSLPGRYTDYIITAVVIKPTHLANRC